MEPITEPGWYRITAWERLDARAALAEIDAGKGQDIILVQDPQPGAKYQSG